MAGCDGRSRPGRRTTRPVRAVAVDRESSDEYFLHVNGYLTPPTLAYGTLGAAPEPEVAVPEQPPEGAERRRPALFDASGLEGDAALHRLGGRDARCRTSRCARPAATGRARRCCTGTAASRISLTPGYQALNGRRLAGAGRNVCRGQQSAAGGGVRAVLASLGPEGEPSARVPGLRRRRRRPCAARRSRRQASSASWAARNGGASSWATCSPGARNSSAPSSRRCRCSTCAATTNCWPGRAGWPSTATRMPPKSGRFIRGFSPYHTCRSGGGLPAGPRHDGPPATIASTRGTRAQDGSRSSRRWATRWTTTRTSKARPRRRGRTTPRARSCGRLGVRVPVAPPGSGGAVAPSRRRARCLRLPSPGHVDSVSRLARNGAPTRTWPSTIRQFSGRPDAPAAIAAEIRRNGLAMVENLLDSRGDGPAGDAGSRRALEEQEPGGGDFFGHRRRSVGALFARGTGVHRAPVAQRTRCSKWWTLVLLPERPMAASTPRRPKRARAGRPRTGLPEDLSRLARSAGRATTATTTGSMPPSPCRSATARRQPDPASWTSGATSHTCSRDPEGPELSLAIMVAGTDFTEENGATRYVPGSNRWPARRVSAGARGRAGRDARRGSIVLWLGSVFHGLGINHTDTPRTASSTRSPSITWRRKRTSSCPCRRRSRGDAAAAGAAVARLPDERDRQLRGGVATRISCCAPARGSVLD